MDETLGKRIVAHRKRVGLTQDKLAEALGVTAQAVSKWENDQSCPDITMLPKLAALFGTTTDALLGLEQQETHTAEVITETDDAEPEGFHVQNGLWEFHWDGGKKSSTGFALWVLLVGGLSMANAFGIFGDSGPSLWTLAWTSGLLVFGLWGLYPGFRFFRLGCVLTGGYFLLNELHLIHCYPQWKFILPGLLILYGLSLLADALRKPKNSTFHIRHNGKRICRSAVNSCSYDGDRFSCSTSFGENDYLIQLSRLSGGEAEVSFGEMTVDLSDCQALAENCRLDLSCAFGSLILLVPRQFRADTLSDTAFGTVEIKGTPLPNATGTITIGCSVNFGQITIRYI